MSSITSLRTHKGSEKCHVVVRLTWTVEDEAGNTIDQGRVRHGMDAANLADAHGKVRGLIGRIEGV